MRGRGWLLIRTLGIVSCLLAGCLRHTLPPEVRMPRKHPSVRAEHDAATEERQSASLSDYQVSRAPIVELDVQPAAATDTSSEKVTEKPPEKPSEKPPEKAAEKLAEPAEIRIQSSHPSSPKAPADPPTPRKEIPAVPVSRPEDPTVRVLRDLLDHRSEEEINEQLRGYDPLTREAMLVLLTSIVQLQQNGGVERMSARDLAAYTDRLNTMTSSLRNRAQLILERMCFCHTIKNFGDYVALPPEHAFFQPGEVAHIYVQVRNISSRRWRDKYVTVLKGRFEIYDENSRDKTPAITWASKPREDVSASLRQDYYINFRFQVPPNCPAGLYTMRIFVEDWTDASPEAQEVPKSRIAQRTLDFRVGGPMARPARTSIAEAPPPH